MDLKRFEGIGSIPQCLSRSLFFSNVKSRYWLPRTTAIIGLRSIIAKGFARHVCSCGLVYAAMPIFRGDRPHSINKLNIVLSLALSLSWRTNTYFNHRGDTISYPADAKLHRNIPPDMASDLNRPNGGTLYPMLSQARSDYSENARLNEISSTMAYWGRFKSGTLHTTIFLTKSDFSNVYEQVGLSLKDRLYENSSSVIPKATRHQIPSRLELPSLIDQVRQDISVDSLAIFRKNGRSSLGYERTSMKRINAWVPSLVYDLAHFTHILPRSASSDEADPVIARLILNLKSSSTVSNPASTVGSEPGQEAFSPVYRTFPTMNARIQPEAAREERTITMPRQSSAVTESIQSAPSAQDLNRISDQVYSIIERRLKIERERRGIYG